MYGADGKQVKQVEKRKKDSHIRGWRVRLQ
jgi:hypothetical protein